MPMPTRLKPGNGARFLNGTTMYKKHQLVARYLLHLIRSKGRRGHGVHSPFVFHFLKRVMTDPRSEKPLFAPIEQCRRKWRRLDEPIQVEDLGAGSLVDKGSSRSISSITRNAAKPPRFGRLFYRLIQHYGIDSVLELGTSLGLTTRYLSLASPPHGVITIEGAPRIADFAAAAFAADGLSNIHLLRGDFGEQLPAALNMLRGKKLLFFDGNHQYAPTMAYFKLALEHAGPDDIFIFDDIHWSAEMEKAWTEIKKYQEVACSLDLFFIGIVFFKKEFKEKLDFSIRF